MGSDAYASPTAAAVGRALMGAGLFWGLFFALSPVPVEYGWIYASAVLAGPGAILYAANLPLRL